MILPIRSWFWLAFDHDRSAPVETRALPREPGVGGYSRNVLSDPGMMDLPKNGFFFDKLPKILWRLSRIFPA